MIFSLKASDKSRLRKLALICHFFKTLHQPKFKTSKEKVNLVQNSLNSACCMVLPLQETRKCCKSYSSQAILTSLPLTSGIVWYFFDYFVPWKIKIIQTMGWNNYCRSKKAKGKNTQWNFIQIGKKLEKKKQLIFAVAQYDKSFFPTFLVKKNSINTKSVELKISHYEIGTNMAALLWCFQF